MSSTRHDEVNEAERRRWNDEQWTEAWPKREGLMAAATAPLLDALLPQDGERVLDVGCGTGTMTLEVARRTAPNGHVVGADVSVQLTEVARQHAADQQVANVRFLVADVQVERIEGGLFDAVVSQFGVMFFDDPVAAFANIRANAVAGARFCFASWLSADENPWFLGQVVRELVEPAVQPAPGKHATGAFALADVHEVVALLEVAGWASVDVVPVRAMTVLAKGALGDDAQLALLGVGPEQHARARALVDEYLTQFSIDDAHYEVPTALAIVTAVAPR